MNQRQNERWGTGTTLLFMASAFIVCAFLLWMVGGNPNPVPTPDPMPDVEGQGVLLVYDQEKGLSNLPVSVQETFNSTIIDSYCLDQNIALRRIDSETDTTHTKQLWADLLAVWRASEKKVPGLVILGSKNKKLKDFNYNDPADVIDEIKDCF